jgi:hypothetical protein
LLTTRKGATLIELLGASFLVLLMTGAIAYAYIAILKAMDAQIARSQARAGVNIALEAAVVDLHHAFQVSVDNDLKTIRFEVEENDVRNFYVYYLRAADGSCPSTFSSSQTYTLMRAPLTGGLNGTYACGSGDPAIREIVGPPTSNISASGGLITFDLTTRVKDSSIRTLTSIRIRNL